MIEFVVPGTPVPKGRPRHTKTGRTYTPKKTSDAEKTVKQLCQIAMRGRKPIPGPIKLTATFTMPDRRVRDIDNCLKLVLDACNKTAFPDDNQIIEIHAIKTYTGTPGTHVTIQAAHE